MACTHDHRDDPLAGFVCDANQYVHGATKMESAVVVVAPDRTVSAMVTNATGAALIARTILVEALKDERSTKCRACAEAHDRMSQALAILQTAPTSC